jgi:hypothetical protein
MIDKQQLRDKILYYTQSQTQGLQSTLQTDCDIFFANSLLNTDSLTVTPGTAS